MNAPAKKEGKILIVEDNFDIQLSARLLLKQHYSEVKALDKPEDALQELRHQSFDVIILDMNFSRGETSGKEGLHWLKKIMDLNASNQVIMITAFGDIELAIQAIKLGARDFVLKPWENEKLLATVSNVYHLGRHKSQLESLETKHKALTDSTNAGYDDFVGDSSAIRKVITDIEKVGPTTANVLIQGEAGTGKELVARAIHKRSARSKGPFIKLDLRSVPESVVESELFGMTKASITDGGEERTGKLVAANGGTIFLDEIGDLSLPLQTRLLQVIKSGKISAGSGDKSVQTDFRLICATNRSLTAMSGSNTFQRELLYLINTVEISIPALRERSEDLPGLAEHFLNVYSKRYGKKSLTISMAARDKLKSYQWPGNVRELRHVIERCVILCDHHILKPEDFILDAKNRQDNDLYTLNLEDLEKDAIKQALVKFRGNISQASKELGLTRSALYRRLEKYGL